MTGKEFMKAVANGKTDPLQTLLEILAETSSDYCVIGGTLFASEIRFPIP